MTADRDARRRGWTGALVVGLIGLVLSLARAIHEPAYTTDFDQFHFAANALLQGRNPYDLIGPGREFEWGWPLNYPLTSVILVIPLAWLPVAAGRVVFATSGAALLGYAICRGGYWRLPLVCSVSFMIAVFRTQWSTFITAAFFLPWAAVFLAAKPNFAAPVLAAVRTRRQLLTLAGIGAAAAAIALIVAPSWPVAWVRSLLTMQHVSAPVTNPGGVLLLLALLRWRRPEARMFAVLACMPQTPSLYDMLPLFLVPRTLRQVVVLSLCTSLLFAVVVYAGPFVEFNTYVHVLERWAIPLVYLPVLAMILPRANVWSDPAPPAEPSAARGVRPWIESLPRFDALLLAMAVASAAFLFWITLNTQRL